MDNQHKLIKGYRDLSKEEIDLMNEIKSKGNELGELIERLEAMRTNPNTPEEARPDGRWLATGRTKLQIGLMLIIRSIAKPTTFC